MQQQWVVWPQSTGIIIGKLADNDRVKWFYYADIRGYSMVNSGSSSRTDWNGIKFKPDYWIKPCSRIIG